MFKYTDINALVDLDIFKKSILYKEFVKSPLGFIDIGARGGMHDFVYPIASLTSVVGFEPDQEECVRLLRNDDVTKSWAEFFLEPTGLFNNQSAQTLHLLEADTNHSLYPPNDLYLKRYNMKKFQKNGETKVKTDTLDSIFQTKYSNKTNFGEFIKIDTQGTEYEILQGSLNVLSKNTVVVVCEVSFFEIYKGQKLFSDVERLMRENGFSFYGFVTNIHSRSAKLIDKKLCYTKERTMYSDAVFFRDPLDNKLSASPRQNLCLFMCAALLGYFDFALEILSSVLSVDKTQSRILTNFIKEISSASSENTYQEVSSLLERIESNRRDANILVGDFVDSRRQLSNYEDVVNASPLPKQYIKG